MLTGLFTHGSPLKLTQGLLRSETVPEQDPNKISITTSKKYLIFINFLNETLMFSIKLFNYKMLYLSVAMFEFFS